MAHTWPGGLCASRRERGGRRGLVPGQGTGRETHGSWSSLSLQPAVTELLESRAHATLGPPRSASWLVSTDAAPVRPLLQLTEPTDQK